MVGLPQLAPPFLFQTTHTFPFWTSAVAGRVSLAATSLEASAFDVQTQTSVAGNSVTAAWPNSRNKAEDPPPRKSTLCAWETLANAKSATASTPKYFITLIFSPCAYFTSEIAR